MSDYWERRKAQQMFEYMAGAEERAGSIAKLYLQASRYFAGKMDTIFERYRKQNGLSEADARRLLNQIRTPGDIDELKQLLRQATEDGDSHGKICDHHLQTIRFLRTPGGKKAFRAAPY